MRNLSRFFRLSWSDKGLLLEAVLLLGLARLAILLLPFRWVARVLGDEKTEAPAIEDPNRIQQARRIGTMVKAASRNLPWACKCLVQAIASNIMLTRRDIPATVYFGLKTDAEDKMEAHAWVRVGKLFVTGKQFHRQFTVINTFAHKA